ncbi:hypothetical protein [Pseudomonas sp. NPDC007930]|uniref:hypothetical protein n=1 Tax=Pseudomonas sp. NPDC007930 TaxID=3364417 RepID=UPI0036F0C209
MLHSDRAGQVVTKHHAAHYLQAHAGDENHFLRQMMQQLGLRTSLMRLKVVSVLLHTPSEIGLRAQDICAALQRDVGVGLNRPNVYDVLRRLEAGGVVARTAQRTYLITATAVAHLSGQIHDVEHGPVV